MCVCVCVICGAGELELTGSACVAGPVDVKSRRASSWDGTMHYDMEAGCLNNCAKDPISSHKSSSLARAPCSEHLLRESTSK